MIEGLQYHFESSTDSTSPFQLAETPKTTEFEDLTRNEIVTIARPKRERKQGRFIKNKNNEFQVLDKRGIPSTLFRISAQDRLDQLSKKELRGLAQTAWDQAWKDYIEESAAERERGVVTVGNLTYYGSPPPASFWKRKY